MSSVKKFGALKQSLVKGEHTTLTLTAGNQDIPRVRSTLDGYCRPLEKSRSSLSLTRQYCIRHCLPFSAKKFWQDVANQASLLSLQSKLVLVMPLNRSFHGGLFSSAQVIDNGHPLPASPPNLFHRRERAIHPSIRRSVIPR